MDRHMRMDSGSSSPNTTYSMAPEAKLRDSARAVGPMAPTVKPKRAPRMVGKPVSAVTTAERHFGIPPEISGTATAMPSGILWRPITMAMVRPPRFKSVSLAVRANDVPMTIPSGTLCRAMAAAITSPARNSPLRGWRPSRCSWRWLAWVNSSRESAVRGWSLSIWATSWLVLRSIQALSRAMTI